MGEIIVVCFFFCRVHLLTLLTNVSVEANSVDPDQGQPDLSLHCLTKRLLELFSGWQKQTLTVNIALDKRGKYFFSQFTIFFLLVAYA